MGVASYREKQRSLLESMAQCTDRRMLAHSILRPLIGEFDAQGGSCFEFSIGSGEAIAIEHSTRCGAFSNVVRKYSRDLYQTDPLFKIDPGLPTTLDRLGRELDICETHQTYGRYWKALRTSQVGDIIGFYFPVDGTLGKRTIHISLLRHSDGSAFTGEDIEFFRDLTPALRLVWTSVIHREDATLLGRWSEHLENEISMFGERETRERLRSVRACLAPVRQAVAETMAPVLRADVGQNARGQPDHQPLAALGLTEREWDVVLALQAGHSNPSMANSLGISVRTVENHLRSIFLKLGVTSRTQVITKTLRH